MSSSPGLVSSTARRVRRAAADRAEDAVTSAADRVRQRARGARKLHTCSCGGKTCPGTFRSLRAQKAHAARLEAGRWKSKASKAAERAMGKAVSDARLVARGWRVAAGLTDSRGNRTAKGRSRPEIGPQPKLGDLRQAHRHDRHHEKAAERRIRAAHHTSRAARPARTPAGRAAGKVRTASAARHVRKANDLEARWGTRQARPHARPASPASTPTPARTAPSRSNGHREAPTRPLGRLAPARPAARQSARTPR